MEGSEGRRRKNSYGKRADLSVDNTKLPAEEQARIRKMLYNQRARPVPA